MTTKLEPIPVTAEDSVSDSILTAYETAVDYPASGPVEVAVLDYPTRMRITVRVEDI